MRRISVKRLTTLIAIVTIIYIGWSSFCHVSNGLNNSYKEERRNLKFKGAELPRCIDQKDITIKTSRSPGRPMSFENKHIFPKCNFIPIEDDGPIPVVFLVNGRSGSDVTWSSLSTLAGKKSPIGEHTGENIVRAKEFIGQMTAVEGSWWISELLCQMQHRHCDKPLIAVKWKPFIDSWNLKGPRSILRQIAIQKTPQIKVIFMTRNPLDVLISKRKHKVAKQNDEQLTSHCEKHDSDCVESHLRFSTGLNLPAKNLTAQLGHAFKSFELFERSLKHHNISYIKTSYEDLYHRDHAEEWMRIFRYLGRGPTEGLTMDDVRATFFKAPTAPKSHQESLKNFKMVQLTLNNTKFSHLIH